MCVTVHVMQTKIRVFLPIR